MQPVEFIRETVFGVSQAAFAVIAGATQGTVSKWEAGKLEPSRDQMERIRAEAVRLGMNWDDRWFFEVPGSSNRKVEVAA